MAKILLVEDDPDIALSVSQCLSSKFHVIEHSATASNGNDRLAISDYDVLILDWNLPDAPGIEVLRSYRSKGGTAPVLMLTAKSQIVDKETGFAAGADDYLTKPFNMRELTARVDALLRRSREVVQQVLRTGDITLHTDTFQVFRGDQEIRLLPKEFGVLEFLMRHPEQVFSAEHLLERVWRSDSESLPETVVTTVKRLRRKIDVPGHPSVVENIRGVGYRLSSAR
jgi:DNA-binding response OmpR family regulator